MLKDITLGQYFPGESFLHKIDPRVKIILTFILIINIFLANNYLSYIAVSALVVMAVLSSKIPFKLIIKGIRPLILIIAISAIINMFYTPGDVIFHYGFITLTLQGAINAILMIVRITLLVIGTSLLTYTTSPKLLTDGLERLLSPLKIFKAPTHEFAMMMTIALRFIPTLIEETDKIVCAQKARGADFETGNLFARGKALIPILVPLFVSAFRRAGELAIAMECRCYRGGEGRTRLNSYSVGKVDYIAIFLLLINLSLIILLNKIY